MAIEGRAGSAGSTVCDCAVRRGSTSAQSVHSGAECAQYINMKVGVFRRYSGRSSFSCQLIKYRSAISTHAASLNATLDLLPPPSSSTGVLQVALKYFKCLEMIYKNVNV